MNEPGSSIPPYLKIPPAKLARGHRVQLRIKTDPASLAQDLAAAIFAEIRQGELSSREPR